jgi:hypothetical protein
MFIKLNSVTFNLDKVETIEPYGQNGTILSFRDRTTQVRNAEEREALDWLLTPGGMSYAVGLDQGLIELVSTYREWKAMGELAVAFGAKETSKPTVRKTAVKKGGVDGRDKDTHSA